MFPISYVGVVSWNENATENPQAFVENFLKTAASELSWLRAREILIAGNRVSYKVPFFQLVPDWILVHTNAGSIEIIPDAGGFLVTYRLSFLRLFVVVSLIVLGGMGLLILPALKMPVTVLTARFGVLAFFWLWMFGGLLLITRVRFTKFIRKILKKAGMK
jgi:hypothetical protein